MTASLPDPPASNASGPSASGPSASGSSARPIVYAAVVAFVGLGLPEGALGITFPALRSTFDVPLSALGLLLAPYTGGYLTATVTHGRVAGRVPIGRVLTGAAACACVGALTFALGPAFAVLLAGAYLLGLSAGAIDASLNAYVSVHLEHRVLAFMHGGFGLGATLGPVGAAAVLHAGWSWRVAYGLLAVWQVGLGITWFQLRRRFDTVARHRAAAGREVVAFEGDVGEAVTGEALDRGAAAGLGRARRGVAALNLLLFFLYTGAEGSTGLLVATLFVDRGLSAETAASLTTGYWLSLTIGRFGTGAIGPRLPPTRALSVGSVGIVLGAALLAMGGTTLAVPGLLLLGLSLAPFFPSLVALTPGRVGTARAPAAIGRQLVAASLGVATVPSLIARVADATTPATIGPCLVVAAGALAGAHLLTGAVAGDLRPLPPPA